MDRSIKMNLILKSENLGHQIRRATSAKYANATTTLFNPHKILYAIDMKRKATKQGRSSALCRLAEIGPGTQAGHSLGRFRQDASGIVVWRI